MNDLCRDCCLLFYVTPNYCGYWVNAPGDRICLSLRRQLRDGEPIGNLKYPFEEGERATQ